LSACGEDSSDGYNADGDIDMEFMHEYDEESASESDTAEEDNAENEYTLPTSEKTLLTRSGAHSYLWFQAENELPRPGLYFRQYSDMYSHFGMFRPLLNPIIEFSASAACILKSHEWHGSDITRLYTCGDFEIKEISAYSGTENISISFEIENSGEAQEISLSGTASSDLEYAISENASKIEITLDGQYAQLWSEALPAQWKIKVVPITRPDDIEIKQKDDRWIMRYAIEKHSCLDLHFEITLNETTPTLVTEMAKSTQEESISDYSSQISSWLSQAPDKELLAEPFYANAWYLFLENTATPVGKWIETAITPSKRHYFRGIWLWDSAFHALALSAGGPDAQALARKQIYNFVKQPFEDGHISREIWATDKNPGTQPPGLLTWASLVLAGLKDDATASLDTEQMEQIAFDYNAYKVNHAWFVNTRDSDSDGLCEWERTDSGWDTSPRWDNGAVEALDLACWMQLDAMLLARMARIIGEDAEAQVYEEEAQNLAQRIRNEFWDEKDGFFYDMEIENGEFVRVKTPATFVPLFTGVASQAQAERVASHLNNPDIFATPYGLPSAAPEFSEYDPEDYWRGPVWIVTNAFAIWGLERYGFDEEAQKLKAKTLTMMEQFDSTYEYYNSQTGEGIGAPDFMWSAAFYIMLRGENPTIW